MQLFILIFSFIRQWETEIIPRPINEGVQQPSAFHSANASSISLAYSQYV